MQDLINCGVSKHNIDVLKMNAKYNYKLFSVKPFPLTHDVKQCGWKIYINDKKIFYATDTCTLENIKAIEYDLYMVEANYQDEEELSSRAVNDYYESRVKKTHLSKEYATNWLLENMGLNSVYCWMHEHKNKEIKGENRYDK